MNCARVAAARDPDRRTVALWLEALAVRTRGDTWLAADLEDKLAESDWGPAREARIGRKLATARERLAEARPEAAVATLRALVVEAPEARDPRFALAALLREQGDLRDAERELRELLERHPGDAEAWNLMAALYSSDGKLAAAANALEHALDADPFLPQALANAGLVALGRGDVNLARRMLGRLQALAPRGAHPEEITLQAALDRQAGT